MYNSSYPPPPARAPLAPILVPTHTKSLRHSHPQNCKGAPTELLPVNPQKKNRKIQPEVKEEIKNEMKQDAIQETNKKLTATELLTQHYEELKQKKKQDK